MQILRPITYRPPTRWASVNDARHYFPPCGNRFLYKDSAKIKNFMNESESCRSLPPRSPFHFSRPSPSPFEGFSSRPYILFPLFTRITAPFRYTQRSPREVETSYFLVPLFLPLRDLPLSTLTHSLSLSLFFGAALSHNRPDDSAVHQNGTAC